jgi:4-carboxymuconolactone decarboxylase
MRLLSRIVVLSILVPVFAFAQSGGASSGAPPNAAAQPSQRIAISRSGSQPPMNGPAENFTGTVRIDLPFLAAAPGRVSGARVAFEPGARTAWHSHPLGQSLIVTAGTGWVQQFGGQKEEIREGDVVWIPAGAKHWHGATPTAAMTHIAVVENLNGKGVEWMEKVSDEQYNAKQPAASGTQSSKDASVGQRLFGDFDPKFAELTDRVLFGDVWERPGLSKRDRSLITVAALIALNRPEQLKGHFERARQNGVTKDEVVEVITHMAFYAGWPNAVNAIAVAKEVFK